MEKYPKKNAIKFRRKRYIYYPIINKPEKYIRKISNFPILVV